jgi:Carboxypeptidase regulatory-like domain/TonB dependent receptor
MHFPKTILPALVFWILLGLVFPRAVLGQAVFGNITGTVTDPAGAAVPNAELAITDLDRGVTYATKTNSVGNYTQTHLLAGHYRVKVTASGFSEFSATADVQVDATTRVDAQIQVGKAETSVTVTTESPLLKADRADVSNTLTANEVERLPIFNRNVTTLVLALPGAQLNNFQHASSENPQGGLQINVNGQYFYSNGFELDGTENHSNILGLAVVNPNPDALQEFKVTTSNYDAEFGNVSGALLQGTTKSGTNQLHGSVFEYLRNDKFNAADPFSHLKPPLRWNQFGGSLGGPLAKGKLFGFFDYQGTRRRTGGALITTVPTAAERSGDLSALLGNYICADGATSAGPCANPVNVTTTEGAVVPAQAGMVFDPTTGNPDGTGRQAISSGGRGNVLPAPNASMTQLLGLLPMPNFGAPGDVANNFAAAFSEKFDSDQYDGRVDYNASEKIQFFGRYSIANFTKESPGAYGQLAGGPSAFHFAGRSLARNQSLALGWTYSLNPTLITDFRFGSYRYRVRVRPGGFGLYPATEAGLIGLNRGTTDTSSMPAFYVNGDGGFNFGYGLNVNQCNCPLSETENHFQWVNNWTKQTGNHTIKWGVDIRRAQTTRIDSGNHRSGELTFADSVTGSADVDSVAAGSATTGLGLGTYLLGQPSFIARNFTGTGFYPSIRQTRLYFFGQDSWRATSKLTLNYGLRYENYLPQTGAKPGSGGSFDPTTGDVLVAGIGSVPPNFGIKAYNAGFAPRIGFAYRLRPITVLRAGYGRSFNGAGVGAVFGQNPEVDPPVQFGQFLSAPNIYSPAVPNFLATGPPLPPPFPIDSNGRFPLPDGVGVYFYFYPLDSYRIPLADFWNFSVQHEIRSDLTAEIAYVGNVGRHLFANRNTNQAVPGPGDYGPRRPFNKFGLSQGVYDVCNCDNSSYHSLQAKLQKRTSHGLDFLLTYTWSKAMTNSEGGYNFSDNYNIRGDHGPASWDHTHALTLLHTWDLPFGEGRRWASKTSKVADAFVGGWRFSGVTTLLSGAAFTPFVSNAPLLNTDFNNVRPDIVGGPHVSSPNRVLWFNPGAYTSPQQPFRNGTASKGSLRGPPQYLFNLSLSKNFVITEGKTLEFRWENFNAFNHTNLGLPNSTVDVSDAGRITYAATDMRQMQLGLHFRF